VTFGRESVGLRPDPVIDLQSGNLTPATESEDPGLYRMGGTFLILRRNEWTRQNVTV